jgi:hypothetical protein
VGIKRGGFRPDREEERQRGKADISTRANVPAVPQASPASPSHRSACGAGRVFLPRLWHTVRRQNSSMLWPRRAHLVVNRLASVYTLPQRPRERVHSGGWLSPLRRHEYGRSRGGERQAQSVAICWRTRTHHAAFSPFVCSCHCSSPPLLKKLLLTTTIVPSIASSRKTIAASRLLSEHFGTGRRIFMSSTDLLLEGLWCCNL